MKRDNEAELALMRRIAARDDTAFEEFLAQAGTILDAFCRNQTRDADEADELRQEVMLRVWLKARAFDGRSSLRTWLYRLVANLAVDEHRRRSRLPTPVARMPEPPHAAPGPEAATVRDAELRWALARLAPHYRNVVLLRDYCDMPDGEVARRCGIATATVRSRLHRARHALRLTLAAS
ncbi:RNA polymerase sigma factor [Actinocorallia sp. API 0066]|uniref:RNA polymerase sigma factor n=1 Tax=Actinocorallia sp. API 0066 TaxID=2896846 RepID=UPI001E2EE75B|nr:RNA polymerase sigma factor [Actinocorallia sp. API 0066]MCD0451270.1 RNA polymerase sigma factor [Actinocorallia sp. API 0066]